MKWFRHDSAAHRDAKLKRIKHKHGIVGYGLYWYCLELIAGNVDKNNITFELEDDAELIAIEWGLDRVTVSEIMADMVRCGLFEVENNRITCLKMAHRIDDTNSRNPEVQRLQKQLQTKENARSITKTLRKSSEISEESSDRLDKIRLDKEDTSEPQAVADHNPARITKADHEAIIALYHQILPELSSVIVGRWHGSKHAAHLASRWREAQEFRDLEFWREFFETVRHNAWWMGQADKQTGAQWSKCNLAWLVKRENFDKVIQLGVDLEKRNVA